MPVTVIELPDEAQSPPSHRIRPRGRDAARGRARFARIGPQDYVIALCIEGKQYASPELAERLRGLFTQGKSCVDFVIGGSLGLDKAVLCRADERMSMSRMTFPHQLARVMLLEQLFRAAKINAGERYHK